jgi:predicted ATPase
VPLFVEELTRLMQEGDGRSVAKEIPATLHDSLMARLDRLGPAKEAAQIGAVIGREFSYELLHAVSPIPEDGLQSALAKLADAELIYARGIPPEATYTFKHALIQDAAYEALLKSRRKELHRRVAATIAEKFPAMAETRPEVLARHWTDAGEAEPAIAAWRKAGDAARARHAFKEAQEAYQQALAIVKTLPESPERDARELRLMNMLVQALQVTRGYSAPEVAEASARQRALSEKSGNLAQMFLQVVGACAAARVSGDWLAASALADQCLDLAQREGSPTSLGFAHAQQSVTRFWRGDLAGHEEYFARGNSYFAAPGFRQMPGMVAFTFGNASCNAWMLGRADTARARIPQAFAAARESNSPYDLAFAQMRAAWLHFYLREPQEAESLAAQSVALCDEHGFPQLAANARIHLGWARAQLGRAGEGVALIRQGLARLAEIGARFGITSWLACLAEAQALDGATADALATIEEALQANPEELVSRPEILRARGELRLKLGQNELAEADFREAIALAQKMSAKAWELRATMSLARLLATQGRRDEARAILAEIYGWFTEGFGTADLKDAKALLGELGRRNTTTSE